MKQGQASLRFENPVYIAAAASVAGKKEGEGPLGHTFTEIDEDPMLGQDNWEAAESELQRRAAGLAMEDGGIGREKIRYLFAGDLLGQLIATSFGVMGYGIPMFGLYGACSTMGEAMAPSASAVHFPPPPRFPGPGGHPSLSGPGRRPAALLPPFSRRCSPSSRRPEAFQTKCLRFLSA